MKIQPTLFFHTTSCACISGLWFPQMVRVDSLFYENSQLPVKVIRGGFQFSNGTSIHTSKSLTKKTCQLSIKSTSSLTTISHVAWQCLSNICLIQENKNYCLILDRKLMKLILKAKIGSTSIYNNYLPRQGKLCAHSTLPRPYLWDYTKYVVVVIVHLC